MKLPVRYLRRLHPACWFWWLFGPIIELMDLVADPDRIWCQYCPRCRYEFDFMEGPWFKCTKSGSGYVPGEPTYYWAEGYQTCPRCTHTFWISDSS